MKTQKKTAHLIAMTLSLLLTACSVVSSPSSGNSPVATSVLVVGTSQARMVATKIVRAETPTPAPTAYASSGITVSVDLNSFTGAPVWLSHDQVLVVVPPVAFGRYGWDVTFDEQFLQLAAGIDAVHPPTTGWIWTPQQAGQTRIDIYGLPDPCTKLDPPCTPPSYGVTLNIKIMN